MLTYDLSETKRFTVVHNSREWRIATHTYEAEVNGIESFRTWGIHETSEEAFLLLEGRGWLVTSEEGRDAGDYGIRELVCGQMRVIEQAERHAIILKPGSRVLIAENLDMSQSRSEPIAEEVVRKVREELM